MQNDRRRFIPLEHRDAEILLWSIAEVGDVPDRVPSAPSDPLAVLLAAGHDRADVLAACAQLEEQVHESAIGEPETTVQRDLLRVCVENSSLLVPYRADAKGLAAETEIKSALRRLAKRLEFFDIEVNHLPD